jgi:nucleotide-binding universal stress UspA family protein
MKDPIEGTARFPTSIVCALDFETRTSNAATAALWLSERLSVPLEFVHAFPPRPLFWGKEKDMPEWERGTETTGSVLRESLRGILTNAPAELKLRTGADQLRIHVSSGAPAHVILERAREVRADLIVLGAHHRHGGLDFGNTVRGVLAHAPAGVWVQREALKPVRRILVPVDLSPDSLRALAIARDLAKSFDARLTVLEAFELPAAVARVVGDGLTDSTRALDRLLDTERSRFEESLGAFDWRGVPHEARFERGDAAQTTLSLQDEHDLIVMGTHGWTALAAALLGSVTYTVTQSARIPVLAIRGSRGTFLI